MDQTGVIVANVPCKGCTACCRWDLIFLIAGDDAGSYLTEPAINPVTGEEGLSLRHKPDGSCVYLNENGCSIHGRAPVVCREFDCRRWFLAMPRPERRRRLKAGLIGAAVLTAARDRLDSLLADPALTIVERERLRNFEVVGDG